MTTTTQRLTIDNKVYAVKTETYYNPKIVKNDFEVTSTILQFESFQKIIPINSSIIPDYVKTTPEGFESDFYKNFYLRTYRNIIKLFFKASKESVFLKSKEELGIQYSGLDLLRSLDWLGVIDTQQLKDEVFNNFANDPCLSTDVSPDPEMHPLRLQIIKGNYYLSCRTHIIDFQLRNLLLMSIFNNNEFYSNDTSYINYIYDTFIENLSSISIDYYNSIKQLLYKEYIKLIDSGIELTSPITNKTITVADNVEIDSNNYLRYLFETQFVFMMNELNSFLSQQITINNQQIKLSNIENIKNYFINNLEEVSSPSDAPINSFSLLCKLTPNTSTNETNVSYSLFIKSSVDSEYLKLVEITKNLTEIYTSFDSLPITVINELKQSIIQSSKFNLLFNYIFPLNKILNYVALTEIVLCSKTNENVNINFKPAMKTLQTTHNSAAGDGDKINCETSDLNFSFGFDVEILKFIAQAPIQIIKGLEETFDPNIVIASKLKQAAELVGAPDLSIIPYSAPLLVPPPFGPAIPLIPPWGYIYWGISAGEAVNSWSNGFKVGGIPDFSGSFQKKNPFKPLC
jgi:hypothetical protein